MGLRIIKKLGFVLEVRLEDGELADERIDLEAFDYEEEPLYRKPLSDYLSFLDKKREEAWKDDRIFFKTLDSGSAEKKNKFLSHTAADVITLLQDENALTEETGLLVIQPASQLEEWTNHDNAIDFYSSFSEGKDLETSVTYLSNFPFPYNVSTVDKNTGKPVDIMFYQKFVQAVESDEPGQTELAANYALLLGYRSVEEVLSDVIRPLPNAVTDLTEWADIFAKQDTVQKLKPAIVTYWM